MLRISLLSSISWNSSNIGYLAQNDEEDKNKNKLIKLVKRFCRFQRRFQSRNFLWASLHRKWRGGNSTKIGPNIRRSLVGNARPGFGIVRSVQMLHPNFQKRRRPFRVKEAQTFGGHSSQNQPEIAKICLSKTELMCPPNWLTISVTRNFKSETTASTSQF